jgi:twinkle protein
LIDDHYKVRLGDFSVVTGIPGHGKTTFINDLCCRMVELYQWPVAFASFEQSPTSDHKRNLRTWCNRKRVIDQAPDEVDAADAWIEKYFSFIVPSFEDDVTLEWVLERVATSVIQHGVKMIVIDPWNEMDHDRPRDMSLTEYTGFAIKQFKALARRYQVHVIVAAHPAKQRKLEDGTYGVPSLYDISDSAQWYNKCDVGVVVHRDDKGTILRTAKSKYHEEIGFPGDERAEFNTCTGRYDLVPEELQ